MLSYFLKIDREEKKIIRTCNGIADETISILVEGASSFSIKSLLDEMPGQKFDTELTTETSPQE